MPVRIPSLDPPVAWAMLVVGYLLYVIACSCASVEKNGSDSNVRSDDVQIGSLADDIVEGEEQLMGGEAALDENEGVREAHARPALSPLFASDNDTVGTLCALDPLGLEDDASIASFDPSSMPIGPPSASSLCACGNNRFAPLALHDDSLQEDDSVEDIPAEEGSPLVFTMGVEKSGDEKKKKKKKLTCKGKSRGKGRSKGDRSIDKGGALPSKRWGLAL